MRDRLASDILDPRTYGRIAYLLLALPLGIAEFAFENSVVSIVSSSTDAALCSRACVP